MVDDLLAVATISGNKDFELCDLNGVLNDAVSSLDQLIEDPLAGDPLHGDWEGHRKLRMGEYRIIYRILNTHGVEVLYVRHAREAYRR